MCKCYHIVILDTIFIFTFQQIKIFIFSGKVFRFFLPLVSKVTMGTPIFFKSFWLYYWNQFPCTAFFSLSIIVFATCELGTYYLMLLSIESMTDWCIAWTQIEKKARNGESQSGGKTSHAHICNRTARIRQRLHVSRIEYRYKRPTTCC